MRRWTCTPAGIRHGQPMPGIDHLKPQTQSIGRHLLEHGSITDMEALRGYRIRRLSARILELRTVWDIDTVREPHAGGTTRTVRAPMTTARHPEQPRARGNVGGLRWALEAVVAGYSHTTHQGRNT